MDDIMGRIRAPRGGVVVLALAFVASLPGRVPAADELATIHAEAGQQWYQTYCTPCHGVAGAPGTAVYADTKKPVDLRDYVKRNGGKFPVARWINVVTTENPSLVHTEVWYRIRKAQGTSINSDLAGRAVVASIASYVRSIQE
jgi:mono/diheme cytochrome c family protein